MFLLYANADSAVIQSISGTQLRAVYLRVFEAIGDVRLVNSTAEITRLTDAQMVDDETLIVAFNACQEELAGFKLPFLCVVDGNTSNSISSNELCLGVLEVSDAGLVQRSCGVNIAWPSWNNSHVQRLRSSGVEFNAGSGAAAANIIYDTGGEKLTSCITFAASFSASDSQWPRQVIDNFLLAFRNNKDVALRLHLNEADSQNSLGQVVDDLSNIVASQEKFACRIICVNASDSANEDIAAALCQPAFAYLANPDITDRFVLSLYWSALIPVIGSENLIGDFALPNNYPWLVREERSMVDVLRGAMHIAVHSPRGYQSLRRMARQSASSLLSDEHAIASTQSLLNRLGIHETMPQLDSIWQQDSELLSAIGIREMITSGWLDQENGTLAPGFPIDRNDVFVDIGCGSGGYSRFAAGFASKVIGCDLDAERLALADAHIREAAQCPVQTIVTDGQKLQLDDASADKIVCTEVLEHVDDPSQVMAELVRIGKPGATYLITVPDTLNERLQEMLAPPEYFEKPNHIRIFEREEFRALIESSGLEIQSHSFRGFYLCFEWLIKWFDDRQIDLMWAKLWNYLLAHEKGPSTKAALDKYIAKSQAIIARKPMA